MFRKSINSDISWEAPTKLLPLSLQMSDDFPQWELNLLREAINASVVSEVSSKCTALIESETKTQMYTFTMTGLRTWPCLI